MTGVSIYIGRQIALLLTVITLGLTFVIWLTQTVRFLDLIINRGLPLTTAVYLLSLLVPELLIILLPAALFIATLFVYWRLGVDSELVVLRSAGMSPWQIARPALAAALLVMLMGYWLCLSLAPHANRAFGALTTELRNDLSQILIQAGVFTEATPGLTVYTRARTADGELAGVVVFDQRPGQPPTIYTAARGVVTGGQEGPMILLEDGTLQQRASQKEAPSILSFESTLVQLSTGNGGGYVAQPRMKWLTIGELLNPADNLDEATRARFRTEANWRLSQPLFALAFVTVALVSLLIGGVGRRAQLWRGVLAVIAVCAMQIAAYIILGFAIRMPRLWPLFYAVPMAMILPALVSLRMPGLWSPRAVRSGMIRLRPILPRSVRP
ncbi:MAG TPA: LptF/LptG family permease [Hypericibacter adhaerens]|jgi:lipopolysaccharide export system permease protein|uniref:LPS export ABC transporter permease LptF n=1 Tax=Hypericibacter adhaerens TaxID=2602016 RepID=A0A5J6N7P7_9PROT|nr:LptF/LptG family permease [Hypericibacter adhaerens]QEX23146.1 LPS export ABC transporter permease LptF [Hypericibacter adhaerens]HWA45044.1 LptF/LptG family permease [Hypericibacter adhaerens]